MIGRYHYSHAHDSLPEHAHPGAMEICYLAKGTQLYRMGRRDYVLRGGDLFVTFPGERHGSGEAPEEKGLLYWVIITLPRGTEPFLICPGSEGRRLAAALRGIRHHHFAGEHGLQAALEEILRAATAPREPLRRIVIAAKLVEFLLGVLECSRRHPRRTLSQALGELLRVIDERIDEPLTVGDLAARAGLSVSRFKARFKQEIGIPPAEYVQRCKIAAAKKLLAERKATITEIAFRLGFSSSQYFATVFRRYTGESPRRWKA